MTDLIEHPIFDRDRLHELNMALMDGFDAKKSRWDIPVDILGSEIYALLTEQYEAGHENYTDLRAARWDFVSHMLDCVMGSALVPAQKIQKDQKAAATAGADNESQSLNQIFSNYMAVHGEDLVETHEIMWRTLEMTRTSVLFGSDKSCYRADPYSFIPPQDDKDEYSNLMVVQSEKYIDFLDQLQSALIEHKNHAVQAQDDEDAQLTQDGVFLLGEIRDGLKLLIAREKSLHPEYKDSADKTLTRLQPLSAKEIDDRINGALSQVWEGDYKTDHGIGDWLSEGASTFGRDGMVIPPRGFY